VKQVTKVTLLLRSITLKARLDCLALNARFHASLGQRPRGKFIPKRALKATQRSVRGDEIFRHRANDEPKAPERIALSALNL